MKYRFLSLLFSVVDAVHEGQRVLDSQTSDMFVRREIEVLRVSGLATNFDIVLLLLCGWCHLEFRELRI